MEMESATAAAGMESVRKHFIDNASRGILLSTKELLDFCKRKGIGPLTVEDRKILRNFRRENPELAVFSRSSGGDRRGLYVTAAIFRPGNVFIDLAYFRPRYYKFNKGFKYLLIGVDDLTQLISVQPLKSKTRAAWDAALKRMIEDDFPKIRYFVSDRDTAIASKKFQDKIFNAYGIKWLHLPLRDKSFHAENMIGKIKTNLSAAIALEKSSGRGRGLRWLSYLPGIVAHYNAKLIKGTDIPRNLADPEDYMAIVAKRYRTDDPSLIQNSMVARKFSTLTGDRIFKYRVGDPVLVARAAGAAAAASSAEEKSTFFKRSVSGSYGARVHRVSDRFLKATSKLIMLPVYRLQDSDGLFYEHEIKRAYFAEKKQQQLPPTQQLPAEQQPPEQPHQQPLPPTRTLRPRPTQEPPQRSLRPRRRILSSNKK